MQHRVAQSRGASRPTCPMGKAFQARCTASSAPGISASRGSNTYCTCGWQGACSAIMTTPKTRYRAVQDRNELCRRVEREQAERAQREAGCGTAGRGRKEGGDGGAAPEPHQSIRLLQRRVIALDRPAARAGGRGGAADAAPARPGRSGAGPKLQAGTATRCKDQAPSRTHARMSRKQPTCVPAPSTGGGCPGAPSPRAPAAPTGGLRRGGCMDGCVRACWRGRASMLGAGRRQLGLC